MQVLPSHPFSRLCLLWWVLSRRGWSLLWSCWLCLCWYNREHRWPVSLEGLPVGSCSAHSLPDLSGPFSWAASSLAGPSLYCPKGSVCPGCKAGHFSSSIFIKPLPCQPSPPAHVSLAGWQALSSSPQGSSQSGVIFKLDVSNPYSEAIALTILWDSIYHLNKHSLSQDLCGQGCGRGVVPVFQVLLIFLGFPYDYISSGETAWLIWGSSALNIWRFLVTRQEVITLNEKKIYSE